MMPSKYIGAGHVFGLILLVAGCDASSPGSSPNTQVKIVDPLSPGAALLVRFCSDCHAPPSVETHTSKEWPNVVYRMQELRRMSGLHLLSEDERSVLLTYLQQHAKKG